MARLSPSEKWIIEEVKNYFCPDSNPVYDTTNLLYDSAQVLNDGPEQINGDDPVYLVGPFAEFRHVSGLVFENFDGKK